MTERIISLLRTPQFGSFVGWADRTANPVLIATFNHPANPKPVTAYCKFYPVGGSERGLINEITGYLFAHALQITQPEQAFIAQIPVQKIKKELSERLDSHHWALAHAAYPVFCTTRLDGKSAGIYLNEDAHEFFQDVVAWPELPKTVAMDENIAHTDRHFNNLIRLKKQRYAAIDNGRLVCEHSESWTADMLDADRLYRNRLSEHLWRHNPTKTIANHVIHCAEQHPTGLDKILSELLYWVRFFVADAQEQAAFMTFLQQRTGALSCLIRKRYQHLI